MLELAMLGLLRRQPLHGYELRKQLAEILGSVRGISYGSLYPVLHRLELAGDIVEPQATNQLPKPRRTRRNFHMTPQGKQHLDQLIEDLGSSAATDDEFSIRLALFDITPPSVRLRILEGRRRFLETRRDTLTDFVARRSSKHRPPTVTPTSFSANRYSLDLHELSLEATNREIRWLNDLITAEQRRSEAKTPDGQPPP